MKIHLKTQRERKHFYFLLIAALIYFLTANLQTLAQKIDYKPGDKIDYKEYSEVWNEGGTFVGQSYDGSQPIIKDKTGFQLGLPNWNSIRPAAAKTAEATIPPRPETVENNNLKAPEENGEDVMTKAEVLGYMRANGYANGVAKHDSQICKDLIEIIKKRGVKERLNYGKDDVSPITENGCSYVGTDVMAAVDSNLGAPVTTNWLAGTWGMSIWGINNKYVNLDNGRVTSRDLVAAAGSLIINRNGTYRWTVEPEGKAYQGSWRTATKEEMDYQGGVGIVLQNAAAGSDWIAYKKMPQDGDKTDRLEVEHIKYRGAERYVGTR